MIAYAAGKRCAQTYLWRQCKNLRFLPFEDGHNFFGKIGLTLSQWLEKHPQIRNAADWSALFDAQINRRSFTEFIYPSPSEEGCWLRISGQPLFDSENIFCGYEGVIDDVSALYQSLLEAKRASDQKSIFVANISHEIRTPLTAVLGMAEILERRIVNFDDREKASTIKRSGQRLMVMLNDLLDLSKIEAGKIDVERVSFDPIALAADVLNLYRPLADAKNIDLQLISEISDSELRVGDPLRFQQILNNLISNAIKFTLKGQVCLYLSFPNTECLVIEVKDSGIGMSAEQVANFPRAYQQAGPHTAREYGGTGLGMAICYGLIDVLAGEIEVNSRLHHGTCVKVILSFPKLLPPKNKQIGLSVFGHDLKGLRILIAEDEPSHLQILQHTLEHLGAQVQAVGNGKTAVDAWAPFAFDAVILDISMPVMDGISTLNALRKLEQANDLPQRPIIALTADVMVEQVVDYIAAGFDTCLSKPVSSLDLCSSINTLLVYDRAG